MQLRIRRNQEKMKRFYGIFVALFLLFGSISVAHATLIESYDFNDGTLQGWTKGPSFNGILAVDSNAGSDGGFMYVTDPVAGGSLLAKAPGLSGDLSYLQSMTWDEYIYSHSQGTTIGTFLIIDGADGTKYTSSRSLQGEEAWYSKNVNFNESEWSSTAGSASFSDVLSNAVALYISMDTTNWSGTSSWRESGVDNIKIYGTNPVPEPATCLLLLFGLVGMVRVKRKFS